VRRSEKEINDIKEIEEVLQAAICCHIGLVDRDEPYVVPVNFGYKDKALYFHGACEGRKISLIKKNNKVCFELETDIEMMRDEEPCQWSMKYRSVIGRGRAHILEDDKAKTNGLRVIAGHYTQGEFTFPKVSLDKTAVVRIDIENMFGKKSGY